MSSLTITFKHLALFVHRPNGLTVVFPKGDGQPNNIHDMTVTGQPALSGRNLSLFRNGARVDQHTEAASRVRSNPNSLLHVADIGLGITPMVRSNHEMANASRWELGGGTLTAMAAVPSPDFPRSDGRVGVGKRHDSLPDEPGPV
jgi:hypothetical protein